MPQTQFEGRLDDLKSVLLVMSHQVEDLVERAVAMASGEDDGSPEVVIRGDEQIDETEVSIEEAGIELLALHQPMASRLRVIVTILKINNDLERVGDHAVNIARAVGGLREAGQHPPVPAELREMSLLARGMLRDALDAFVHEDSETAREVLARDDRVDALHESLFRIMLTHMLEEDISACLQVILIGRNLERIADLATNIGEDVVYMVRGTTIRHGAWERPDDGRGVAGAETPE